MKKVVIAALIAATILPTKGQMFSRDSLGGALLGGVAGGIIGHNSGGRTAEGIGIGAGAGLLLGALSSNYRRSRYEGPYSADYYYYSHPVYTTYATRPNYAATGTIVGGIAGGVIGHNSGRQTAEGLAIGAGAGLLIGGVAEHEQRKRERALVASSNEASRESQAVIISRPMSAGAIVPAQTATDHVEERQRVRPVSAAQGRSSMSSVNALFGR